MGGARIAGELRSGYARCTRAAQTKQCGAQACIGLSKVMMNFLIAAWPEAVRAVSRSLLRRTFCFRSRTNRDTHTDTHRHTQTHTDTRTWTHTHTHAREAIMGDSYDKARLS